MHIFKTISLVLAVAFTSMSGHGSLAQDYEKGWAAFQEGDFETVLKEWRPLAEQGYANAQNNLGVMCDNGDGVPQDDSQAVDWYRKAAEQGYADAHLMLGLSYHYGDGVPQDSAQAVKWYRKAAEQGYADAHLMLGQMYYSGAGGIQDNVYAHMWFNIAASLGEFSSPENRSEVAKRMTAADISKAQELARECVKKNYKGC
jgi:TPR repeat protein